MCRGARGALPGAVNVPAADLPSKAKELLPRDGRIRVLYGRTTDEARPLAETLRDEVAWYRSVEKRAASSAAPRLRPETVGKPA